MAKQKQEDEYGEPQYLLCSSGVVCKIRHPILTPEERERRMKALHDEAARYLRHVMDVHGGEIPKYPKSDLTSRWITKEEYQRITGREG